MRDLLNDLESGSHLSDPDPIRRAQNQMRQNLPKRFYKAVKHTEIQEGFSVLLDGKSVRTPGRAPLVLPSREAAALVAGEFDAQRDVIDPVSMPVLRLVNSAIDGVAPDPEAVIEDVVRFSGSDLICYRAGEPAGLVARQAEAWDPVLDWARAALGARFILAEGVVHVEQPRESVAAVRRWLGDRRDPFRLAAIHVMTTLTGSALLALAVEAGALDPAEAWAAAHVDESWNAEHWGDDAEAVARQAARRRDFDAAVALAQATAD
ncbi:MAG: ATPase [Aquamicrobium sp.]|uniref:ATP12 family chaperone protein n=1 Tax=Aquamicrobium sp. TaxID=1872579 RepID=UPI00349EA6E6|nr:ATPase [Aquamicrobium sp.]